ncbi:MAG: VOC family protein [Candidatus Micrarchaeales archaeon]
MDSIVHFEIPADDTERAKKFYKGVFGWQIDDMPEMNYTILRTAKIGKDMMPTEPGRINGGMMKRSKEIAHPVVTIAVDDIDATLKKLEKAGGKTVMGKQSIGGMGFTAYFKDSEGNVIGLWQMAIQP